MLRTVRTSVTRREKKTLEAGRKTLAEVSELSAVSNVSNAARLGESFMKEVAIEHVGVEPGKYSVVYCPQFLVRQGKHLGMPVDFGRRG